MSQLTRRELLKSAATAGARRIRRCPDDAQARAGGRPGRRHRQARSAFQHVVQRHPVVVQPLRQPHQPSPRRQAPSRARHRVEAERAVDVDLQAARGREVPQRGSVQLGRRQVQHRAHVRSERQDDGGHRAQHDRPDRGARRHDPGRAHQEAGSAAARAPGLLRRADRAEEVRRVGRQRRVQRPAGRDRSGAVRVVDEGRQARVRGQSRLLGRQGRLRPADHALDPRDRAADRLAPQGRGRRHHPASRRPG